MIPFIRSSGERQITSAVMGSIAGAAWAGCVRATGTSEVMEMFPTLVVAVVAWAYIFVETN